MPCHSRMISASSASNKASCFLETLGIHQWVPDGSEYLESSPGPGRTMSNIYSNMMAILRPFYDQQCDDGNSSVSIRCGILAMVGIIHLHHLGWTQELVGPFLFFQNTMRPFEMPKSIHLMENEGYNDS